MYYKGEHDTDSVPFVPFLIITLGLLVFTVIVGIECTQVEDVLAYKGGIFGSLMVYIFPPLMYVRLSRMMDDATDVEVNHVGHDYTNLSHEGSGDESVIMKTIQDMFSVKWRSYAFLFTWGVVTGLLGVTVTILQQSGAISK